jgi:AcrR family transcriptional regulator
MSVTDRARSVLFAPRAPVIVRRMGVARSPGEIAPTSSASTPTSDARQRLVDTAYTLICKHGVRAVGVDTIIERSDVAKMTMYRHFGSKDELVIEVMRRRESLWTEAWLADEVRRRTDQPAERLLTIFDVFDEWFRKRSFEGCLFINVLLEIDDRRSMLHRASRRHLANIREVIASFAADAGIVDTDEFAREWHILMKGSIVAAAEGDLEAALRARAIGRLVLAGRGVTTDA